MSKQYTQYLTEHRKNVQKAFDWLYEHKIIEKNIKKRLENHDISKYTDAEYHAYDEYFYSDKPKTEEIKNAFNLAWLHHIHKNPHHWQHWVLINDDEGTIGLEMPENYAIEMFCDWWSFSFKKNNLEEIFDWYEQHKNNMVLHENTRKFIENILKQIKSELKK